MIARIDNPYSQQQPLRIGQYVEAEVTGNTLNDVFVIPRSALREDRNVLVVDEIGTLQSRDVEVAWKDAEVAVISSGLNSGDILNITSLGSVTNGTRVKATIDGVAPQEERRGRPEGGGKPEGAGQSTGQGKDNSQGQQPASNNSDNGDARMQRLKAMVDAGEELPPQAVAGIKARIAAGEEVPAWLKQHIEATAK